MSVLYFLKTSQYKKENFLSNRLLDSDSKRYTLR